MANTTTARFVVGSNQDQTYRVLNYDMQTPTATAGGTVSIDTYAYSTKVSLGVIPAGTINVVAAGLTAATQPTLIIDSLEVIGIGPATGTSSIVFGSDFKMQTSNTISVSANQNLRASFTYNGTYWVGSGFAA